MIGDQVDGAIVVDDHDAAAGVTMRVRIPALPPDRQHVLVQIPAGTANKTVLVLPGAGFGSPPGDLRIQVLVRAPASGPRPESSPRRPPGRGRPRNPVVARLTGLRLAVVILLFAALLGLVLACSSAGSWAPRHRDRLYPPVTGG
jgi:DnaJ-class molecular chaperone